MLAERAREQQTPCNRKVDHPRCVSRGHDFIPVLGPWAILQHLPAGAAEAQPAPRRHPARRQLRGGTRASVTGRAPARRSAAAAAASEDDWEPAPRIREAAAAAAAAAAESEQSSEEGPEEEQAGAADPEAAWEPASHGGDAARRLTGPVPPLSLYNEGELGVLMLLLPASDSRAATLFMIRGMSVCKREHDVSIAAAAEAAWINGPAASCLMSPVAAVLLSFEGESGN